jgi:hypothetical protein
LVLWKSKTSQTNQKEEKEDQINKITDGKGGITTEIQRIVWEYFEKLYANESKKNPEEMDKSLDTYGLQKLNKKGI